MWVFEYLFRFSDHFDKDAIKQIVTFVDWGILREFHKAINCMLHSPWKWILISEGIVLDIVGLR